MNSSTVRQLSLKVWQNPLYFITFGFGSGLLPIAPGTWGTLAAIPLYLIVAPLPPALYLSSVLALFLLGVYTSDRVAADLGVHDYKGIVIDEMVGYLLTMWTIPYGWGWIAAGFFLFRLFDVWKPLGINLIDKHMKGGLGIMLDDVAAGFLACAILKVFSLYL